MDMFTTMSLEKHGMHLNGLSHNAIVTLYRMPPIKPSCSCGVVNITSRLIGGNHYSTNLESILGLCA